MKRGQRQSHGKDGGGGEREVEKRRWYCQRMEKREESEKQERAPTTAVQELMRKACTLTIN